MRGVEEKRERERKTVSGMRKGDYGVKWDFVEGVKGLIIRVGVGNG